MWIIIQTGFSIPSGSDGLPQSCELWDAATRKKIEADAKATQTLQCGLTKEELNRVGPFSSAKDLWTKLIELHEGTSDTKEKGIALLAGTDPKKTKKVPEDSESSESETNDEVATELVNLVRKMFRNKRGIRRSEIKKVVNKSKPTSNGKKK
ncbi:uncharacterized protein LOC141815988 [Curcuma longa]|uniref:uncharacterized protein LOC141815988 n=1 Tax=Curcuma longa TaxID=136217 RepID=UPI003D9E51C1